jgi:hypothetical protein
MSDDNRKPIIIAIACAVVAIAIFVLGIGFGAGGRDDGGSDDWSARLAGVGPIGQLATSDLALESGSCDVTERLIVVRSSCSFTIAPFGGPFDLGPATKQADATFIASSLSSLELRMTVEGTEIAQEARLGSPTTLTIGRGGGRLTLVCAGLEPCVLELG